MVGTNNSLNWYKGLTGFDSEGWAVRESIATTGTSDFSANQPLRMVA